MLNFIVGADFMCALGIQIIIIGIFRQLDLKKTVNIAFMVFTLFTFFMVISEGISGILSLYKNPAADIFSVSADVLINLSFMVFFFYTWVVLGRSKKTLPIMPLFCVAINALNIAFSVRVSDHNVFILLILDIIVLQLYLAFNNSHFTNLFLYSYFIYSAIILVSMTVELLYPRNYNMSRVVFALINILMFLLIQMTSLRQKENTHNIAQKMLYTDHMTGTKNRQAYVEFIEKKYESQPIAAFYCDINGLKKVNDKHGHKAGDNLIIRFSNILLSIFNPDNIFRISGDVFVIILPNCDDNMAHSYFTRLQKAIIYHDNIASFGYSQGSGENIRQIIAYAEKEMKISKEQFYKN